MGKTIKDADLGTDSRHLQFKWTWFWKQQKYKNDGSENCGILSCIMQLKALKNLKMQADIFADIWNFNELESFRLVQEMNAKYEIWSDFSSNEVNKHL
jgi:protein tyrosine phosphatase